jgi:Flp pilus assembly pilin Flp
MLGKALRPQSQSLEGHRAGFHQHWIRTHNKHSTKNAVPAIDGDFPREREGAAMIDVALMIVVIGAVVIAVLVDVAALVSWLRRRRS